MRRPLIAVFALCALAAAGSAAADPKAEVHAAFAKFLDAHSFRATVTDVTKGQQLSEMEYVAPDRYHMKTGKGPETFIIGDEGYMDINGRMMKVPVPVGKIIAQYRNKSWADEHGVAVVAAGSDSVEGEAAHVYTYSMTEPNKAEGKLWVSDASGYPIQLESAGSFMGVKTTTRVRYSDFNDPAIHVSAPSGQ
jgi:outer membrane lipoprotein-sorting protein